MEVDENIRPSGKFLAMDLANLIRGESSKKMRSVFP